MIAKIGDISYRVGCALAWAIAVIFTLLAFWEFSDPQQIWGFMLFGMVLAAVPLLVVAMIQLILQFLVALIASKDAPKSDPLP